MANGRLIYGSDGFSYERNGKTYDLLEGKTIGEDKTSGICFVMETDPEEGFYTDYYGWFFLQGSDPKSLLKACDEYITGEPNTEEQVMDLRKENEKLRAENRRLKEMILEMDVKVTR